MFSLAQRNVWMEARGNKNVNFYEVAILKISIESFLNINSTFIFLTTYKIHNYYTF